MAWEKKASFAKTKIKLDFYCLLDLIKNVLTLPEPPLFEAKKTYKASLNCEPGPRQFYSRLQANSYGINPATITIALLDCPVLALLQPSATDHWDSGSHHEASTPRSSSAHEIIYALSTEFDDTLSNFLTHPKLQQLTLPLFNLGQLEVQRPYLHDTLRCMNETAPRARPRFRISVIEIIFRPERNEPVVWGRPLFWPNFHKEINKSTL